MALTGIEFMMLIFVWHCIMMMFQGVTYAHIDNRC